MDIANCSFSLLSLGFVFAFSKLGFYFSFSIITVSVLVDGFKTNLKNKIDEKLEKTVRFVGAWVRSFLGHAQPFSALLCSKGIKIKKYFNHSN